MLKSTSSVFRNGQKVVLAEEPDYLWCVRAAGERFAVLTRPMDGDSSMAAHTLVDLLHGKRTEIAFWPMSLNCDKYLREVEKQYVGRIEFANGTIKLNILPPRRICKMITLRITKDEHRSLSEEAMAAGLSVNTHLLRKLGIKVPDDGRRPRGRKPITKD